MSFLYPRQNDVACSFFPQQRIHELVHMNEFKLTILVLPSQLSIINQKRLQISVTIQGCAGKTHVKGTECSNVFELLIFYKLHDDVFFRLYLEHLQYEAEKRCWLDVTSKTAADEPKLHGLVDEKLSCESKTLFFPVLRVIDPGSNDFFH